MSQQPVTRQRRRRRPRRWGWVGREGGTGRSRVQPAEKTAAGSGPISGMGSAAARPATKWECGRHKERPAGVERRAVTVKRRVSAGKCVHYLLHVRAGAVEDKHTELATSGGRGSGGHFGGKACCPGDTLPCDGPRCSLVPRRWRRRDGGVGVTTEARPAWRGVAQPSIGFVGPSVPRRHHSRPRGIESIDNCCQCLW